MMDLHDRFAQIAPPPTSTSPEQADQDVARGRSALRRRRAVRGAGASVFAVAALAAVVAYGAGNGTNPTAPPQAAQPPAATTTGAAPQTVATRLVAY